MFAACLLLLCRVLLVDAQLEQDCQGQCSLDGFDRTAMESHLLEADSQFLFEPVEASYAEDARPPEEPARANRSNRAEPPELRSFKVRGFAKKADFVYGPWETSAYRRLPMSVIRNFKGARSVMNLVAAYTSSINKVEITGHEYSWFTHNARNYENVDTWMESRYLEMDAVQAHSELPGLLRQVIDPNMPEPTIRMFVRRIEKCKYGGTMVRFVPQLISNTNKMRLIGGGKIFAAACSNPSRVQVLVLDAIKSGYMMRPNSSPRIKRKISRILRNWAYSLFYSRFSVPSNA